MPKSKGPCRHCQKPATRPRRLCSTCYYNPAIRALYQVLPSKFNNRGVGNKIKGEKLPELPCPYLPGSPEKIIIMARRAARGECLFHPQDGIE